MQYGKFSLLISVRALSSNSKACMYKTEVQAHVFGFNDNVVIDF